MDPLAAYLADIAVLLPDVLPARARAAVQALVAEGVHAQDDVVNGAIDDLLAEEEDDGMDQDAGEDGGEDVDAEGEEEEEEDADDAGPDAEAGGAVAPVDPRPPPAPPPPPTSPADDATTHLLLLLPDIDPAFARQTVDSLVAKGITSQGQIVDQAMDVFFALPKGYPKAASATGSKRKRDGDDDEDGDGEARGGKKQKVDRTDYGDVKRRRAAVVGTAQGKVYDELSIATMSEKFGLVPVPQCVCPPLGPRLAHPAVRVTLTTAPTPLPQPAQGVRQDAPVRADVPLGAISFSRRQCVLSPVVMADGPSPPVFLADP